MVHAAVDAVPEWAAFLGVPVWLGGAAFLIWLWLTGKVQRTSDVEARMAEREASIRGECQAELTAAERNLRALQDRIDHVVPDRDAWREAHAEAQRALQASERAAAALMETGQISLALLGALKDALAGKEGPGG